MAKWVSTFCSRYQITQLDENLDHFLSKPMFSKLALLAFFCTSLSFAVILTIAPNLTVLWVNTRQLFGLTSTSSAANTKTDTSISRSLPSKYDWCSRNFPITPLYYHDLVEVVQDNTPSLTSVGGPKRKTKTADLTGEALSSIHLAMDMVAHGKIEKAAKLFHHAMALNPLHPDILTEYGEFLEHHHKDIVKAEHMYCRALIHSPRHSKALVNRKRTLPLVEEIDQNYFNAIDNKLKILMSIPENHPGLRRMMKESYYKHIYHTAAIEGNTFTLSQTRMLVENRLAIGGKSVMEHNEIIGMDSAFTFVNNSLINRVGSLTMQDIKNIHKRVLGFVDPIGAGEFRTTQVVVGEYVPPEAKEILSLMEEFMEWLNSEEAMSLHPMELAAIAHYKLVWIHPFYDGNGRTSRLLMNLVLMQAGFPPIIIHVEEKHIYYQHLETANNGDIRPFIRFIARCTERAIDEYLSAGLENAGSLISGIQLQRDDGRTIIIEPEEDQN